MIPAAGAALAYGIASALHGSGFIAAFVGGIVFRLALRRDPEELNQLSEEVGAVLNAITFILFGAILLGPALTEVSWQLAVYAVLSLTIVRMIPVAIAMWRSHARRPTVGFVGWFGPRGLASIVFAVIVVEESQLPHEHLIVLATYLTVGLSVLAHGLTAAPLAGRYARWYERHPRETPPPMESAPAELTRPRGPVGATHVRPREPRPEPHNPPNRIDRPAIGRSPEREAVMEKAPSNDPRQFASVEQTGRGAPNAPQRRRNRSSLRRPRTKSPVRPSLPRGRRPRPAQADHRMARVRQVDRRVGPTGI